MAAPRTIESVIGHHVQALASGDLKNILEDYADDAVMFSPGGAFQGKEGIKTCFTQVLKTLKPEIIQNMKLIKQDIVGDYVYVVWSAPGIPLGSDTICIRDGKIVMQSFVSQANT